MLFYVMMQTDANQENEKKFLRLFSLLLDACILEIVFCMTPTFDGGLYLNKGRIIRGS